MVSTRRTTIEIQAAKVNKKREKKLRQILPPSASRNAPESSGTDADLENLYSNVKSIPNYSAKIADFLRTNTNHSIHRRIVKKIFPRRKIITHFPFQIFQADLIEYPQYTHANSGHRFILIIIDCFSKMVYAAPVKRKNADYMSEAFEKILGKFNRFPNSIITDQGLEFYNERVKKIFETYGINHYHTKTKTKWKAAMAERVIRTLKSRLEKYFYQQKSKRWIGFLPQLVKNYNATPHRTIGMAPDQVTDQNSPEIYKKQFGGKQPDVIPRLEKGDKVRILVDKSLFDKGYKQNWTEKIFKIKSVYQRAGVVWYKIEDLDNNELPGIRYYWQLNLVSRNVSQAARNR